MHLFIYDLRSNFLFKFFNLPIYDFINQSEIVVNRYYYDTIPIYRSNNNQVSKNKQIDEDYDIDEEMEFLWNEEDNEDEDEIPVKKKKNYPQKSKKQQQNDSQSSEINSLGSYYSSIMKECIKEQIHKDILFD